MHIDRMQKALKVLEEIQSDKKKLKKFDLTNWGKLPGKNKRKPEPELKCATQACGLGSIALAGVIKGLTWVPDDKYDYQHTNNIVEFTPVFKENGEIYENFRAAEEAFGIDEYLSHWLFHPDNYSVKSGDRALAMVIDRMKLAINAEKLDVGLDLCNVILD